MSKDDRNLVAQLLDYANCESEALSFTLELAAETIASYSVSFAELEAERDVLKHELEEALQEISSLQQCDCIVRGAE